MDACLPGRLCFSVTNGGKIGRHVCKTGLRLDGAGINTAPLVRRHQQGIFASKWKRTDQLCLVRRRAQMPSSGELVKRLSASSIILFSPFKKTLSSVSQGQVFMAFRK